MTPETKRSRLSRLQLFIFPQAFVFSSLHFSWEVFSSCLFVPKWRKGKNFPFSSLSSTAENCIKTGGEGRGGKQSLVWWAWWFSFFVVSHSNVPCHYLNSVKVPIKPREKEREKAKLQLWRDTNWRKRKRSSARTKGDQISSWLACDIWLMQWETTN